MTLSPEGVLETSLYCIPIESEVVWPRGRSLYFRDPEGNSVELAIPALWGLEAARS